LANGIHPQVVQERLGRSSIQITLDPFSHVTLGIQPKPTARMRVVIDGGARSDGLADSSGGEP